jgi:hypothetical protein
MMLVNLLMSITKERLHQNYIQECQLLLVERLELAKN